jgi:XTP/dITP diphosphohydrolase
MLLYVATSNPGKLRDFAHAAEATHLHLEATHLHLNEAIRIEPLPGLATVPAPPEDEPSFEGNARAKAIYYASFVPGHLVLADDSGLEVACLDNAPGVRSARYAEDQSVPAAPASTPDERNNVALLRALDGIPEPCRTVRYRCVLALARRVGDAPAELLLTAEGTLEGRILTAPRGALGFGYDPLFLIPELDRTMAEVDPATRLMVSHRGRALRSLLVKLNQAPAAAPLTEHS